MIESVKIVAQPTSVKMITGETFVAYVLYANIPEEPTIEDLNILEALDIGDSMFIFVPSYAVKCNDGYTFTPWLEHTELKVFRINRNDVVIAAYMKEEAITQFDAYIESLGVCLPSAISKLFSKLGLEFTENQAKDMLITNPSIQYLADLNKYDEIKH